MRVRSNVYILTTILMGMLVLSACPPKKKMPIEEKSQAELDAEAAAAAEAAANAALAPGDVRIMQDWTEVPALQAVPFNYDAAQLSDEARAILKKNVTIIKKLPSSVLVRVEGHCDDRGTVEYNIALGERRANTVRAYYQTAGVAKSRLETISFGEERPLCNDQTDDCWARNRRGVTKVRNKETVTIKAKDLE